MEQLFRNYEHQMFFEKKGFFKPTEKLLSVEDINDLNNYINTMPIRTFAGFEVVKDYHDKDLVFQMMDKLNSVFSNRLNYYFDNYKIYISSYLIKAANGNYPIMPHQDETFVEDESKHLEINCWIPLTDSVHENGCIGIIEGSHKIFDDICPIPASKAKNSYSEHIPLLVPYIDWLPMQAGEVLFLDYRTIHASLPNLTNNPRIAISVWITHKDAKYCTYYINPKNNKSILKYKTDKSFYINYSDSLLSNLYDKKKYLNDLEFFGEYDYIPKEINKEDIIRILNKKHNSDAGHMRYFTHIKNNKNIFYDVIYKLKALLK